MRKSIAGAIVVLAAVLAVSGCAGNESYPNDPKPPATLSISVIVGEDSIALSPNPFGAGPTRFVTTNQTGVTQKVLFSSEQFDREVEIGSGQTFNFKQTVAPGELSVSADKAAADAVIVDVGPQRKSAQQDLNQP
ncbi:MAG: hypothetical protein JHC98_05465 [Thermoleophilaceae bacterium]|nr:hypothetical protein [Thermoleophilaceae bacterium]